MDLNHRGTIISRASLPLDESSIWCLRRDSNPYEFLYPADFKSAVYSYSTTQAKNMAAALRIELRLAESKSAVLTVIRYRYIIGTGTRIRTKIDGFGDRSLTVRRYPHMAEEMGFEPMVLFIARLFSRQLP